MTATIYGIKNCDTMKKAGRWLDAHGVAYRFHDYKTAGIDRARLEHFIDAAGWEAIPNRAGTTFKVLSEAQKADLTRETAIELMLAQPSMIKRGARRRKPHHARLQAGTLRRAFWLEYFNLTENRALLLPKMLYDPLNRGRKFKGIS